MLKPQVHNQSQSFKTLFTLQKPFLLGNGDHAFRPVRLRPSSIKAPKVRVGFSPTTTKAIATPLATEQSVNVKAVVTVKQSVGGVLSNLNVEGGLDDIQDWFGKSILLELVSDELDPNTGLEKPTIKGYAHTSKKVKDGDVTYEAEFQVHGEFGEVGAIIVENEHHKEMYVQDIVLDGFINGPIKIHCASWVHSKHDRKHKRVFFTNKSFLPSETPEGLKRLRDEELMILRGNGQGERKTIDRVYDYDVYNDLGSPDEKNSDLARPVLGGKEHPYPRRCRSGRPRCKTDPASETRSSSSFYVPRDETFAEIKQLTFSAKTLYCVLHALVPTLETATLDTNLGFPYFTAIDSLFNEGVNLPPLTLQGWKTIIPRLVKAITDTSEDILRFETPDTMQRDKFFWFRDEEFARQTLAGLNPLSIQLITEWPLKSNLDPETYGPPESAITKELIEKEIKGFMTFDEALKQKKLFMLDYHDLLLPYVKEVRGLKNTSFYGSRTIFFLTPSGALQPLAIELTRPPMDGKPQWKRVYSPSWYSTECWLWRIAKSHVLAHDSGYHQLVSHWLRTHCCTEPYIIAANRQLSAMHPIYRLLHPHFRYTMEINALARQSLINAEGVIESAFAPGKYSIVLSSDAYDKQWRFDYQALPKDLISRGLAVEDPSAPHGLKLTIEDYPYANDGLILWDAIKQWVSDYVNHYYPDPSLVESDKELQEWWSEIRNVGHGDKKDEPWWPDLKTPEDLTEIITTIVWVTSGHHAAVNFGQYTYAGYFPNRPTVARTNMPDEDASEEQWKFFMEKPEVALLSCFPSQMQATKVMAVLDVLSSHSPDEEYLGEVVEPSWAEEPLIKAAFEKFSGKLKELEGIIDERNAHPQLVNRNGAGVVPYELLKPTSEPGVTAKGVPYSISI
ncbi:hypothetical protein LWI29_034218 [Acer saccharum]|uniref:Lipoxygenase n=1 Tax=Acer saccharum TaxID=4024 RepID=A0AA39TBP1_ACESA|nr:hypothetical protein LWI29_034218 [Acer saccharum]KAK1587976.1 hypothetical protein Q3G72_018864 [Acer saccharum]